MQVVIIQRRKWELSYRNVRGLSNRNMSELSNREVRELSKEQCEVVIYNTRSV